MALAQAIHARTARLGVPTIVGSLQDILGRLAQPTHGYPIWSLAVQQAPAQFFGQFGGRTARPAGSGPS
jgi:hypothetical protein